MKHLMAALSIFLLPVFFAACTHTSIKNPAAARTMMFPDGSYQHEVDLKIGAQKNFHFSGAVEIKSDHLSLVAFSPFGTTLFRITDDRQGQSASVKTEIYADQIKPHETQMQQFYQTIRSVLTLPYNCERSRDLQTPSGEAKLVFEHVDAHGIPDQISITNPHFILSIKVVGYEI